MDNKTHAIGVFIDLEKAFEPVDHSILIKKFNYYIVHGVANDANDICNVSKLVKLILFVDDTNIFCAGCNLLELLDMLNRELTKLCIWFAVNKLSLNLSKNNYMLFRNRPPEIDINVYINNERTTRAHVAKFLGVFIDDDLNWKNHLNTVI